MRSGVGKARPWGPLAGASGAGSPRCSTIAPTIRRVADHAQFVVQMVFTTSSKTVGLRSILPAPRVTQASSGSSAASA